ncbi:MAG: hypothetical protein HY063_01370 [Bacteroidetes bacterium]|nr:hypothetical protein [Bacteroidota bacterium]
MVFFFACLQFSLAQEESSPLLKEKEKESGKKKIKTSTGVFYSCKNGAPAPTGVKYSMETFNGVGNLLQSFFYSADGELLEAEQYHYDTAQKLVAEKKQLLNLSVQKHLYHYGANGNLEYGEVYMDTELVHTCSYLYDKKNRLSEIITEHHILIEKNIPVQEAIVYAYDESGNKIKESDYEIELSSEKFSKGGDVEKAKYTIKKLISLTDYLYDKNSFITQLILHDEKGCIAKTEFRYDADGKITEEIHYAGCAAKPDYLVKYSYEYY